MPEPICCPDAGRLYGLLTGNLPPGDLRELTRHLEDCERCQQAAERLLASGQQWPDLGQRLAGHDDEAGPALRRVMEQARRATGPGETEGDADGGGSDLSFLTPSDKPGSLGRLGRYEILDVVGRGGMGVVLKGFDEALHRVVAIKVMASRLAAAGLSRQRFQREARAAAAVSHEHVVAIHGVEEADGLPYLVMHYVAGVSLQERVDRTGPLDVKEVLRIGMQAAAGLAAAHAQGLVHRDIKPANILLENGVERVKITDFGLARAVDDVSMTQSGVVVGTAEYMAPEQARGEPIDHRADLFSLGGVLYAMCAGRPPFRANGTMAVLKRVCEDTPRPLPEINPNVPKWLCAIIDKLLAKEPAERFQSAAEVADLLGRHLAHVQQPNVEPMPAPVAPPRKTADARRKRWETVVVIAVPLLVLGPLFANKYFGPRLGGRLWGLCRNYGILEVVTEPAADVEYQGDVKVVVRQGANKLMTIDKDGWEFLPAGHSYELTVEGCYRGPPGDLDVSMSAVLLGSGSRQVVKVFFRRKTPERAATPADPPITLRSRQTDIKVATLAEAVDRAASGDVITLHGDGPFDCPRLRVEGKALTIRAEGCRPVLRLARAAGGGAAFLETSGPLTLEGLELQWTNDGPTATGLLPHVLRSVGAPLRLANCRFVTSGECDTIWADGSPLVEVRNCQFLGARLFAHLDWVPPSGGRMTVENCVLAAEENAVSFHCRRPDLKDVRVRLARNTLAASHPVMFLLDVARPAVPAGARPAIEVEASECVVDGLNCSLCFDQSGDFFLPGVKGLSSAEAEALLPRLVSWRGERNLHHGPAAPDTLRLLCRNQPIATTTPRTNLAAWDKFWDTKGVDCQEGRIHYLGGHLQQRHRVERDKLLPRDFGLHDDSPGKKAGAGGRDIGVDVSLVGPGDAYERWKMTDGYAAWRKATGGEKNP